VAQTTRRRIARRLIPFLLLLYVVAFLDRVNVAYAGLEMTHALGFSDRVFGLGAGIFFIGYLLLEIPGALLVERWSARKWIARIMVSWGLVTLGVAFVHTPGQFYAARFLLGAAEAGFFPGVIVYLTHWFRADDRAKAVAMFLIGIPIANIVGSPLAGFILRVHWYGLPGWRWLFLLEGIPAVVLGVVTLFYLTDWPHQARWLGPEEQEWITSELEREKNTKLTARSFSIAQALREPAVIACALVYCFGDVGLYGFTLWFPTMLKRASGLPTLTVTLLAVLPYVVALAADLANGWHSDRTGERRWHVALPLFIGGVALLIGLGLNLSLPLQMALFGVLAAAIHCWQPPFWALPSSVLTDSAAAASIGLINSVGHVGAFTGPYLIGYLKTRTQSFTPGLLCLAASLFLAGIIVLQVKARDLVDAPKLTSV
jgi:ACS family tartrate transporter-like MFS transporter